MRVRSSPAGTTLSRYADRTTARGSRGNKRKQWWEKHQWEEVPTIRLDEARGGSPMGQAVQVFKGFLEHQSEWQRQQMEWQKQQMESQAALQQQQADQNRDLQTALISCLQTTQDQQQQALLLQQQMVDMQRDKNSATERLEERL